jgi:hypothetical protein
LVRRTTDFGHFSHYVAHLIYNEGKIADVSLMEETKFTPSSWKVWKQKLIEKFSITGYDVIKDGMRRKFQAYYDKKDKQWGFNFLEDHSFL